MKKGNITPQNLDQLACSKSLNRSVSLRRSIAHFILLSCLILSANAPRAHAQKPKLAIVGIDVQADAFKNQNITELVRIQLTKYDRYQQLDRYEIRDILKAADLDPNSCFSLTCLKKSGELLKVEKIISGSMDRMGEALYVRVKLVDVKTGEIEKEILKEFLVLPEYVNSMITLTLNELFDLPNDKMLERSLSSKNNYENSVNNPNYNTLKLSGPRMGYTFFTGRVAETMKKDRNEGGFDAFPATFQFGYQFEKQYLSEGKYQALFEFLPMISGLDQQMFIPSFTIMNGLRNNVNGWEFAVGPTFSFVKEGLFYEDVDGIWKYSGTYAPEGMVSEYRLDSRGEVRIKSSIILAIGTSLRSGKMNIPINAFVAPGKGSFRYGLSFGFNSRG